jgi:hypothetical protein
MGLPRTFVSFSSTDYSSYNLMCAWKAKENIDFNFIDCQLAQALRSEDENYIKSKCRERIGMASTFLTIIGKDTKWKYKYVRWEAEVAIEKKCRLICVDLDNSRFMNSDTCPKILQDAGAVFVPFSPPIIKHALESYEYHDKSDWIYNDGFYTELGYRLIGNTAIFIPKPKPWEVYAKMLGGR